MIELTELEEVLIGRIMEQNLQANTEKELMRRLVTFQRHMEKSSYTVFYLLRFIFENTNINPDKGFPIPKQVDPEMAKYDLSSKSEGGYNYIMLKKNDT